MKTSGLKLFVKRFLFIAALAGAAFHATWATAQRPTRLDRCQEVNVSGSYVLVDNLTAGERSPDCLVITATSVTIDLAGFQIIGNHGEGVGIKSEVAPGVAPTATVRNGTIVFFDVGVSLGTGSLVEGVRAVNNAGTGIMADGIVSGNIATANTRGIVAGGIVRGNIVTDNNVGMVVSPGSIVSGNVAQGNSPGGGIVVFCPSNVIGNTAINNTPGIGNLLPSAATCSNIDNVAPAR